MMKLEARFEKREAFRVVGLLLRAEPFSEDIPQLWRDLMLRTVEIEGRTEPGISYGVEWDMDEANQNFNYLAGYAVAAEAPIPEGMTEVQVPAAEYAVFDTELPRIQETIEFIYEEWLPTSGYAAASGLDFELYDQRFDPEAGSLGMSIYLPVLRKLA